VKWQSWRENKGLFELSALLRDVGIVAAQNTVPGREVLVLRRSFRSLPVNAKEGTVSREDFAILVDWVFVTPLGKRLAQELLNA